MDPHHAMGGHGMQHPQQPQHVQPPPPPSPHNPHSPFGAPNSPLEMKPDTSLLQTTSPGAYVGSPASSTSSVSQVQPARPASPSNYPPLNGSKHLCYICGDRASGKHYGVFSCEGCKGFFKRTVRKELQYACRENGNCTIDKRQRNRCQSCRYNKCLDEGMKREAVQEERHRSNGGAGGRGGGDGDADIDLSGGGEATSHHDMPIEQIVEAETIALSDWEADGEAGAGFVQDMHNNSKRKKMLQRLVDWAKNIPQFKNLRTDDQVTLIQAGWNELMIAGVAFRSLEHPNSIVWTNGQVVSKETAHNNGVGEIFDRVLVELVGKMKELKMDKAELGCLRAIVLFNPDAKDLASEPSTQVERYREKVYATLEEYCRKKHENEPSRFAKLLLRLPALRSIGLKCVEHLFFFKIIKEEPLEQQDRMDEGPGAGLEEYIRRALTQGD